MSGAFLCWTQTNTSTGPNKRGHVTGSDRERTAPSPPPTAPHYNTTAYEVFMELPYVDGLFLMRNWEGQVVCYDLRQK